MKLALQLLDRGLVLGELLIHIILTLTGDDLGGAGAAALLVRLRMVQGHADVLVIPGSVGRDKVFRRRTRHWRCRVASEGTLQITKRNNSVPTTPGGSDCSLYRRSIFITYFHAACVRSDAPI